MKNSSKKMAFILVMAIIVTISLMMFKVNAADGVEKKHICPEVEYTYEGMDADKAEQIISLMIGKTEPQRGNIFCIFGHDKKTGKVVLTEHYYYLNAPKCRETTSFVEYCARSGCDYYVVTAQTIVRVACH